MNDAADHASIVNTRLAARIRRKMRRDFGKLRVRQPELIPIHLRFLSEAVNHTLLLATTILWVWTLNSPACTTGLDNKLFA
jgi:hypothetical protein